jgi:cathepsin A (carboxypeptidase C)/serine carboxypeptidase-like clade 2
LSTGTSRDTHLFYWYHEAVVDPKSKPLLLWLNGGPGCSSLGGMFTELGPFVVQKTLNVTFNPYSFNKVANVLFLEQPAGVGFSYPNLPANDTVTAYETYKALLAFFNLYPDLRGRPFCTTGRLPRTQP